MTELPTCTVTFLFTAEQSVMSPCQSEKPAYELHQLRIQ